MVDTEYVTLNGYVVKHATERAIGIVKEASYNNDATWIPRRWVDNTDVLSVGDTDIIVARWKAEEEGLTIDPVESVQSVQYDGAHRVHQASLGGGRRLYRGHRLRRQSDAAKPDAKEEVRAAHIRHVVERLRLHRSRQFPETGEDATEERQLHHGDKRSSDENS